MSFGGHRHPQTDTYVLIGSKTAAGVRTGVELESTYSTTEDTEPTKTFAVAGYTKMTLDFLYTMGGSETSNTIEVKLEGSPDRVNWYELSNDDTSGATSTLTNREFQVTGTNGSTKEFQIFIDVAYKYVRVSCKESGVASNKGNVFCEATLVGA